MTFQGRQEALEVVVEDFQADLWLEAILASDQVTWLDILIKALPMQDGDRIADMIASGDLPIETLATAAKDLLTAVAARPWWEVFNIIAVAEASWEAIGGEMASRGLQADLVTLGTWLDAAFYLMRKATKDEQAHDQLVTEIKRKPMESTDDGEMDTDDFMAAMTELGGGPAS